ncbi:hypothetical protein [Neorhodopirellula pilleata]|uniref:Uncharacterized protein n=1 Tax=Neorhodopirellula pilleata TaxID=2714738 RepID=A0A5C5ZZS3_9BACT|nr:hypothetical protein [Neorhodopirellula pilleata]TWT92625.1 hypothetical protein Pla100_46450 [Neorhodopirellula pilleata]
MDWLQNLTADWDWNTFWPETLGKATGVIIGIMASWFLLIRRRLQSMNRLKSGDSDDVLFQAHYLVPVSTETTEHGPATRYQLLFRNVAEKKIVPQIYDNPAAAELVKTLGDQTSLNQPILPTQGTIGFEVLNDAASWMSGVMATSSNQRRVWLFCMTAEDRQVVRKRCVRCFLIRPEDLERFHDWNWCCDQVSVERPWHWFRVVALHRVARLYADQCRMHSHPAKSTAMPLVDDQSAHRRIVPLSLGLIETEHPICEPFELDWAALRSTPAGRQLILEEGPWPDGLSS